MGRSEIAEQSLLPTMADQSGNGRNGPPSQRKAVSSKAVLRRGRWPVGRLSDGVAGRVGGLVLTPPISTLVMPIIQVANRCPGPPPSRLPRLIPTSQPERQTSLDLACELGHALRGSLVGVYFTEGTREPCSGS